MNNSHAFLPRQQWFLVSDDEAQVAGSPFNDDDYNII